MNLDEKTEITVEEFKAFMTGLIAGKKGALPDVADWTLIKKMLDKVQPTVVGATYYPFGPIVQYPAHGTTAVPGSTWLTTTIGGIASQLTCGDTTTTVASVPTSFIGYQTIIGDNDAAKS